MKVLVIDDDAMVTAGIKTIIEMATKGLAEPFKVVGVGHNGQDALRLYPETRPDVILMDIRMPEMDGIEAGKALLSLYPEVRIIYLTTFLEDDYIVEALKLGAKGYLLKTDYESLIPAIEAVANGQHVYGDEIIAKVPAYLSQEHHVQGNVARQGLDAVDLSTKEVELIQWVAEGLNNKEIAEKMHFTEGTIRNYLSAVLEKLELRDRTQLAIYYFKHMV
ncbi:response regulator transcription factor [Fundicoccus culcitae]|uniref:Response regulator transcription factor n=1 Tax=Fundicoccus culcitae TaxID=2969821 RepID=A0ABY5P228_9LACT|nr:response regulator transcription factor [Fundicoccus culcitae]UUX32757.1 response regulator transcription factor [Fundicoccus culcitae]